MFKVLFVFIAVIFTGSAFASVHPEARDRTIGQIQVYLVKSNAVVK